MMSCDGVRDNVVKNGDRFYLVEVDGRTVELPSVTTIIRVLDRGEALVRWKINRVADAIVSKILSAVSNGGALTEINECFLKRIVAESKSVLNTNQSENTAIGSAVHSLIESALKSGGSGIDEASSCLSEQVINAFRAFRSWSNDVGFVCLSSEMGLYDIEMGYAGRADCVCMVNGKKYIVDYKTSNDFYEEYPIQVAAYVNAYNKLFGPDGKVDGFGVLRLDKGSGKYYWMDYSDLYEYYFAIFKGCCEIYRAKSALKMIAKSKCEG